jgi:hypothetical protein
VVVGSERRSAEEEGMGFEQTMEDIARGVEIIGIVTLVLGLAAALVRAALVLTAGQVWRRPTGSSGRSLDAAFC